MDAFPAVSGPVTMFSMNTHITTSKMSVGLIVAGIVIARSGVLSASFLILYVLLTGFSGYLVCMGRCGRTLNLKISE